MIKHCISVIFFLFLLSCKDHNGIPEPEKLIEKDVMVDIMYDLSVLEAIKYQNPASLDSFKINASAFILKKYKVDSIQYMKNNKYYAADDELYKSMFEKVIKRLEADVKKAETQAKIDDKKAKSKKNKIKTAASTETATVN
jgi:hypothetical protein